MTIKNYRHAASLFPCAGVTAGALWLMMSVPAGAQLLTPAQQSLFNSKIGDRVEAATILGGDYGLGGGAYKTSGNNNNSANINVSKFGGMGDIYPIRPLGDLDIGWQPQLQGSLGYLTANKSFQNLINGGDNSENKTFAIQFGGGARFWFNDNFSIAPTLMGMYGHSENTYTAVSPFGLANQAEASREGLINWSADTWTIRPSVNVQYQFTWQRTIITLSSEPTYFYTQSFNSTGASSDFNGYSEMWQNKIDVDVPLGVELWGHELRTGGYFSRTDLFGGLQSGLSTDDYYDAHARLTLDFLGELWKVKWLGIGVSHLWGGSFTGWSYGVDAAFRF
jgi:hypothetical protein